MTNCYFCEKPEEEVSLFEGVSNKGIRKVCYNCSKKENIALIKKPTKEQLEIVDKRRTVREVMEGMGIPQKNFMTKNQIIAHKNLAKLRFPEVKQEHGDLVKNYDWILKQSRRRSKMTTTQLSRNANVSKEQYELLESGQLIPNFQQIAKAVENVLGVKILKVSVSEVVVPLVKETEKVKKKRTKEEEILESVRKKMERHFFLLRKSKEEGIDYYEGDSETEYDSIDIDEIARDKLKKQRRISEELESGKFDFSKKGNLDKITLRDLADLKKLRKSRGELELD